MGVCRVAETKTPLAFYCTEVMELCVSVCRVVYIDFLSVSGLNPVFFFFFLM